MNTTGSGVGRPSDSGSPTSSGATLTRAFAVLLIAVGLFVATESVLAL